MFLDLEGACRTLVKVRDLEEILSLVVLVFLILNPLQSPTRSSSVPYKFARLLVTWWGAPLSSNHTMLGWPYISVSLA